MLEAVGLECVRGGRTLFEALEFKLDSSALLRIAGANGSGKTSLLRILCGLALPERGAVRWRGESIRALREEYHRQLIYIGHASAVKDELTARENLVVSCALGGAPIDDAAARLALERLGLGRFSGLPARHLSQGQRRRVALARLAACEATPLWILDEPFTALDAAAVDLAQDMIAGHVARGGIAVITSHQDVTFASVAACTIQLDG
jgi:heme exporter protein A